MGLFSKSYRHPCKKKKQIIGLQYYGLASDKRESQQQPGSQGGGGVVALGSSPLHLKAAEQLVSRALLADPGQLLLDRLQIGPARLLQSGGDGSAENRPHCGRVKVNWLFLKRAELPADRLRSQERIEPRNQNESRVDVLLFRRGRSVCVKMKEGLFSTSRSHGWFQNRNEAAGKSQPVT